MVGLDFRQTKVVVVNGARTPFGKYGGQLAHLSATQLAVEAGKAAIEKAHIDKNEIQQVIFGNVLQTSSNAAYLARHVGLNLGLPEEVSALNVNRLCGSGMQAVISGAEQILLGKADVVLVGGTENMSQAPFTLSNAREKKPLKTKPVMGDMLWDALNDESIGMLMGETAELLAQKYSISREKSDHFAHRSHEKYEKALKRGFFDSEITPVMRDQETIQEDEHPRKSSDLSQLEGLKPAFYPSGVVTAASASGISDGACALILMSEHKAKCLGIEYLATLSAYNYVGYSPKYMGLAPIKAIQNVLLELGKSILDIDQLELHEAFAPQALAVLSGLGIHARKVNLNGGTLAMGHPLGASSARIVLSLARSLKESRSSWGLAAACIGGGQGIALALEVDG